MAQPIGEEERANRRQQVTILKARRARWEQELVELEEGLRSRLHEPEVQQAFADARHNLEEADAAIARLESLLES